MKTITHDLLVEDFMVDIDFDMSFDLLEQIAPPADFVEQVMRKVAQLPLPVLPKVPWSHLSVLTVDSDATSQS